MNNFSRKRMLFANKLVKSLVIHTVIHSFCGNNAKLLIIR